MKRTPFKPPPYLLVAILLSGTLLFNSCRSSEHYRISEKENTFLIQTPGYQLAIQKKGFSYQFSSTEGEVLAPFHAVSGLQIAPQDQEFSDIVETQLQKKEAHFLRFEARTASGLDVHIDIWPTIHSLKMEVKPIEKSNFTLVARTGPIGQAFGMGDHAAFGAGSSDLELTSFNADPLQEDHGKLRMLSNFVIFPKKQIAFINMHPREKIIRLNETESGQGSSDVPSLDGLYYFIGNPKEIYKAFLTARNEGGFPVYKPKHEWFGVGWEAFGALAWKTNQKSVTQNIQQYLDYGYPLSWMVLGSGFWPSGVGEFDEHGTPYGSGSDSEEAKKYQATTSFGMWDKNLYPDPRGMIDRFHQQGLIFNLGLRIAFIPRGPFTEEGVKNAYFIPDSVGSPQLHKVGFPRVPVYLLNTKNPEAVSWYANLCKKWLEYGVDGFKEDLFAWPNELPDDLIDPVNRELMDNGVFIMGRNNYLGSPADIHRFQDFNYNQSQDRGPINGLAYAFSGFPYVYPDIIGGTGLATGRFGEEPQDKLKIYIIRYAQYAALNPSMAFGYGPWNFDEQTNQLCLEAARLHHRLKPHIFSNAIRAYETGYPYPMTPLPLAFPNDPEVYSLADTSRRSYQWLIGESLMATPLYGDDYPYATSRAIYLPEGKWMDYHSGEVYDGGQTLENFDIPLDKIPLFVGGNGVVIEQEKDQLFARVYPINPASETVFWDQDGTTQSKITLEVSDWDKMVVKEEGSGKEIKVEKQRHAWQFPIEAGKNYQIH